jgi:hypothetical protein
MSQYAVLIIVYKRLNNLEKLITNLQKSNRDILVYVDYADCYSPENQAVISCVRQFTESGVITSKINTSNVGPGYAIPEAVQWGFNFANYLLVLEDDCEIGINALEYFTNTQSLIDQNIKIISGRAAWDEEAPSRPKEILTLTNYALTNGWLVSIDSWSDLSVYLSRKIRLVVIAKKILFNPSRALPLLFFYSACLVNMKTERKAWDCFIVLQMILENYYAVNPDLSCISTGGIDEFATNTKIKLSETNSYISFAGNNPPSYLLNRDKNFIKSTNKQIERNLYMIKFFHLLSPLNSWFKTFKYKST